MNLAFTCLLVDNDGEPLVDPFVSRKSGDEFVSELADTIRITRLIDLNLWKPEPLLPSSPLSELPGRVKALHLNVTGNRRGAVLLDRADRLGQAFLPHQPFA